MSITSPKDGSTIGQRKTFTITASATDASGINYVQIRVDGNVVCKDTAAPYTCSYRAPSSRRTLKVDAVAVDKVGNSATSAVIQVIVR